MKTILKIEIETPDKMEKFFPESGEDEDSYEGKEEELATFRYEFAQQIHETIIDLIKTYVTNKDDQLEEEFLDSDCSAEDCDELKDYGIKITFKQEATK